MKLTGPEYSRLNQEARKLNLSLESYIVWRSTAVPDAVWSFPKRPLYLVHG